MIITTNSAKKLPLKNVLVFRRIYSLHPVRVRWETLSAYFRCSKLHLHGASTGNEASLMMYDSYLIQTQYNQRIRIVSSLAGMAQGLSIDQMPITWCPQYYPHSHTTSTAPTPTLDPKPSLWLSEGPLFLYREYL